MLTPNQSPANLPKLTYAVCNSEVEMLDPDEQIQIAHNIIMRFPEAFELPEVPELVLVNPEPRRAWAQMESEASEEKRDLTRYLPNGDRKKLLEIGGFVASVLVLCALYSAIFGKAVAESAAHDAAQLAVINAVADAEERANAYTIRNRNASEAKVQQFAIQPLETRVEKLEKSQPRPILPDPRDYLGGK